MNKERIELLAELAAIKYVLQQVGKIAFLSAGLRPAHATKMRANAREILGAETFPELEAVWSDHVAAEIAENVDQLLAGIEASVKDAYRTMSSRNPDDQ